ncbi:MAG: hypothetical protein AAF530_09115 [Pseudomonadota bacterium]
MPEAFKNVFNPERIAEMGKHLERADPNFDRTAFVTAACDKLETLELKQRSDQICQALARTLPGEFEKAAVILEKSLASEDWEAAAAAGNEKPADGITAWPIMPLAHYVSLRGQDHFELSLTLLREMTKRFTAEFAIRPFILAQPDKTLAMLWDWTEDPNHHVRRLVSEGTRPRLPWGLRLPPFIENPEPIFPLLERIKDDDSDYVRRSVANNLNDIAKDHPDRVAQIAKAWLKGASAERQKLVRHACRSLIKQGHPATMGALGFGPAPVRLESFEVQTPVVHLGEALIFDMALCLDGKEPRDLVLDYVIHHRKANGSTSAKVFKWKSLSLSPGERHEAARRHKIKAITTRVYYSGPHGVEIMVNGKSLGRRDFDLIV